jgi:hypothetical protein
MTNPPPLPDDLSGLERKRLDEARAERDDRTTALFRRWPGLTKLEMTELRRLWNERLRLARQLGARRRGNGTHEHTSI